MDSVDEVQTADLNNAAEFKVFLFIVTCHDNGKALEAHRGETSARLAQRT